MANTEKSNTLYVFKKYGIRHHATDDSIQYLNINGDKMEAIYNNGELIRITNKTTDKTINYDNLRQT